MFSTVELFLFPDISAVTIAASLPKKLLLAPCVTSAPPQSAFVSVLIWNHMPKWKPVAPFQLLPFQPVNQKHFVTWKFLPKQLSHIRIFTLEGGCLSRLQGLNQFPYVSDGTPSHRQSSTLSLPHSENQSWKPSQSTPELLSILVSPGFSLHHL